MAEWRNVAHRTFVAVAVFSVLVNLLMLTLPVYLFPALGPGINEPQP